MQKEPDMGGYTDAGCGRSLSYLVSHNFMSLPFLAAVEHELMILSFIYVVYVFCGRFSHMTWMLLSNIAI